jgi:predicted CoA-binding protein
MTDGRDVSHDDERLREHLEEAERIAVIGMKPRGAAGSIPAYIRDRGYEIVPVNPTCDEVLGLECVDRVDQIEGEIDVVDVFRRSETIPGHVDEILQMEPRPALVWLQLGIRHDDAATRLTEAGIDVVQDACIKVEHGRLMG